MCLTTFRDPVAPDSAPPRQDAPEPRACGPCQLCCRLPEIEALDKPANRACVHCRSVEALMAAPALGGCLIYPDRPQPCRDFSCLWRQGDLGPDWAPLDCHMMVYRQGPQLTVLVDPDHQGIDRREPYATALANMAAQAGAAGGYVIVFTGDAVRKVAPAAVPGADAGVSETRG